MKYILLSFIVACFALGEAKNYKICVPKQFLEQCRQMAAVETKSKAVLECVPARDRMECLFFVQQRQADFVPVDPEDMYIASRIPNQDFVVFQEFRTQEEPDAEFRYEAVMVVHKDFDAKDLDGLKGRKSCHTGVNRNVGYKIPLTMLMKLTKNFPKMNDQNISPKENELKALATYFSRSCIVGTWSPDNKTNTVWKNRYSQLCSLCEHPEQCDYPDNYSGYEGALRCLVNNGGEVAFTKVIYVRKFFGLPVGTIPAGVANAAPDDYRYLCADGSRVPIRNKACSWAARPWQGLLGHHDILARLTPVRIKMKQLSEFGSANKANWYTNVLGFGNKTNNVLAENIPISPSDYLDKANYTAVIERGHGAPEPVVRLCVTNDVALEKCRLMSVFAFSRDIRPKLDCVRGATEKDCLEKVRDNGADFTSVKGEKSVTASKEYNLHPVFHEVYGEYKKAPYSVAVIKKSSNINNLEDLRGKASCHGSFGSFEGVEAPVYYLIQKNIIHTTECPRLKYLAEFFSGGSCIFGADNPENNPAGTNGLNLTKLCQNVPEMHNPSDCLQNGNGDIAFMSSLDLYKLDPQEYQLLCLNKENGGRDELNNYETCNVVLAPSRVWLAAKDVISDESIAHTPLSLAQLLEEKPELFNIYGEFLKNENVIFSKHATGLATTETFDFNKLKSVHDAYYACY